MASGYEEIADDEYRRWLYPAQALATLTHLGEDEAATAIGERLRASLIKAAAEHVVQTGHANRLDLVIVPQEHLMELWIGNSQCPHWRTGQMTVRVTTRSYPHHDIELTYYGLRFEPTGIEKMLPSHPNSAHTVPKDVFADTVKAVVENYGYKPAPPPPPVNIVTTARAPTSDIEKKPISAATLNAWWDMCKTIRPADQWNNDQIRSYFDRCFPDAFPTNRQAVNA